MSVALRHYDFAAARARQVARVHREKRLVYDAGGAVDFDRTRELRELREGVSDALLVVEMTLVRALSDLPIEEGGLRADGAVRTSALSADIPLVKARCARWRVVAAPAREPEARARRGRGASGVATMHDLRAWCLQGIWGRPKADGPTNEPR